MVRAKFRLVQEKSYAGNGVGAADVKELIFSPQYDQSIPEDQRFAKASPSGELKIQVNNPAALEQLKLGEYYYLDFTPVPAEAKPAG